MKRKIYILTENGRNCGRNEINHIIEQFGERFGKAEIVSAGFGKDLNNRLYLADLIERDFVKKQVCVAVISDKDKSVDYFPWLIIRDAIDNLENPEFTGNTSWEILTKTMVR